MRYKNLDLNLLVVFDALMEMRSVTHAARKLRLSQPAVSASLERLRIYFNDPLLVAKGKHMQPTATANDILPSIRQILGDVDSMVASSRGFDPTTSQRVFRIVASDFICSVLLLPLAASLRVDAPRVQLDMLLPTVRQREELERGEVDLMFIPDDQMVRGLPAEEAMVEKHVVVGSAQNPALKAPLTEEAFLAHGHVGVFIASVSGVSFAERQLAALGKHCRYEVRVPTFTLVPQAVTNTNRVATMYGRLAHQQAQRYGLKLMPLPFPFPPLRLMMQYHRSRANDPGLIWLKERIRRMADDTAVN